MFRTLVLLLPLLAACGGAELAPCAAPDAGEDGGRDGGMTASPLGAVCGVEGALRCVQGVTYACWPSRGPDGGVLAGELRWTGLDPHWFACTW